jgi:hypothetical protein
MFPDRLLVVADTSVLTDADWAELNKLRRVHAVRGSKGLLKALRKLAKDDPVRYFTIAAALFPAKVLNAMKDHMAENGITKEDVEEMARKLHPAPKKQ